MAKSKSSKTGAKASAKTSGKGYQSISEKITALRAEIEKLEAEEKALLSPHQEFPKFIADPRQPGKGRIVATPEEEKAAKAGEGEVVPMSDEFNVTETTTEDADAEAGGAHGDRKKVTTHTKTFKAAQPKAAKQPAAKKASAKKPAAAAKLKGPK